MQGLEAVTIDLDEPYEEFISSVFGYGKSYSWPFTKKRVGKIVFGEAVILSGKYEVIIELTIFTRGEIKVAKIVYIYKPDDRIKEIFYERRSDDWVRVDIPIAAKVINKIEPFFSVDYKTIYDGFSAYGVFSVVIATFALVLFH